MQKVLTQQQVEAFHHDCFVEEQVAHFVEMVGDLSGKAVIVDVGGGIGLFAHRLQSLTGHEVRVLDLDQASVALCERLGVKCSVGDALKPEFVGDEGMASFNMILHHLVGATEKETRVLQARALGAWHTRGARLFVNEYIYESQLGNFSGWLIYQITKSKILSAIGRAVSTFVPSLRANTFGVGVRFRSVEEWRNLFEAAGYRIGRHMRGEEEPVSIPQRMLLIKNRRRDSFLLETLPR